MAFSTQKDFFDVPFLSESYELGCKKACVKLKSYESTEDTRAWASDDTKRSKFLSDLVTCEYPLGEGEGDRQVALTGSVNTSKSKQINYDDLKNKKTLASEMEFMTGGDSLLQCANIRLAEYQKLLKINTALEKQLEVSSEHLRTAKEEKRKILEILANKLDSNTAKDFYNKIKKFTTAGKFNKNEENEMLQIYQKMKNMNSAYEILQAENNYLRRLIEKLTTRVQLENITVQPEQSQDIVYLQNEINMLRKECLLLRQFEDDYQRLKQQQTKTLDGISEQNAESIKLIIKERNSLREKCKSFKALEQQVEQLEYESQEAKKEANDLNSNLANSAQYINTIEREMQSLQKFYEKEKQESCLRNECLKAQLEELRDEFVKAKCEAHKAHMLAMEVSCLRNELMQRDLAINDYDCQYAQLMDIVSELRSVKVQSLYDNETQTCQEQTNELAFYTCASLEMILNELKRRGCLDNKNLASAYELEPAPGYIDKGESEEHCCTETQYLKQQMNEMKKQMQEEAICKDALVRLQELETQNSELLHDNQNLNEKLIEGEVKLANMLKKLEKLDEDINRNGQEAIIIGRDLEENIALVKDISDMQLKNKHLANAVSAINSRDDQKIIDDLRRQLEQESAKLRKCQQENASLLEEVNQRETDLKQVKEHNNKLVAENNKLKNIDYVPHSENKAKREDETDETKYKEKPAALQNTGKNMPIKKGADQENSQSIAEIKKDKQPSRIEKIKEKTKVEDDYKEKKPTEQIQQRSLGLQEVKTSPPYSKQKSTNVDSQKLTVLTDSDGFATSTSKEATRKKPKVTQQDTTYINEIKTLEGPQLKHDIQRTKPSREHTSVHPSKDVPAKQFERDQGTDLALDDFVNKKSDSFKFNLQRGRCFEKEFRKILEEFIFECSNHCCRLYNAKSKLYIICHKLCHNGIDILNFQELAYIHKKIYNQADKLLPGCMLDMILTEHREQVESILTSVVMPRLMQSKKLSLKTSDVSICNDDQKCCCCKNELCCNNSEEMLKEKVSKLEKDIGIAREYLETLRNIPLEDGLSTDNENSTDTNNSTYRASSPIPKQQKLGYSKHVKKLKARTKKQTGI